MNINPIKLIYKYNKEKGLLDSKYVPELECSFAIEEALESFDIKRLKKYLNVKEFGDATDVSRRIISFTDDGNKIRKVDSLDKHVDMIIYSFGSIFKLGLSPQEAMSAINIVAEANMHKSDKKDSYGKNKKGLKWENPEPKLLKLLEGK